MYTCLCMYVYVYVCVYIYIYIYMIIGRSLADRCVRLPSIALPPRCKESAPVRRVAVDDAIYIYIYIYTYIHTYI